MRPIGYIPLCYWAGAPLATAVVTAQACDPFPFLYFMGGLLDV